MPLLTDDDLVLDTAAKKKPASVWRNWWDLHREVGNLSTGEILGPGLVPEQKPYPSKDAAETAAKDWVRLHAMFRCQCGFGPHSYKGAFEDGKAPA